MKRILVTLILSHLVFGQEILQHFDLDKANHYVGTTTYEFDIDRDLGGLTSWTLDISNVKGEISFNGEPGNIIQITEEISIWSRSGMRAKAVFDDYRAQIRQLDEARVLEIKGIGEWPERSAFEYSIVIPVNTNIKAKTSGGDIDADNIAGEFVLITSGGDIDLEKLTGKIIARTSGGDVWIENSEGMVSMNTSGGDIEASHVAGEVQAVTSGGDIDIESVQGDVKVKTSGGDLYFKDIVGRNVKGNTSGGDIEAYRIQGDMDLYTSGGDIEIDDLNGSLDGTTSGGDIEVDNIRGNANVTTSGGDIEIAGLRGSAKAKTASGKIVIGKIWDSNFADQNIDAVNDHGSIFLTLPEEFPARIDAVVENEISSNVIESDFPLTIDKQMDEVRGEGTISSGTHLVKLRTNHGIITIEKSNYDE